MDLLSISLDLDLDSSCSQDTTLSNNQSKSSKKAKTPRSVNTGSSKNQNKPNPTTVSTPVYKNIFESTPESSKRVRSQGIRRYSPTPDGLDKKKFSNLITKEVKAIRTVTIFDVGSLLKKFGTTEVTDYVYIPCGKPSQRSREFQKKNPPTNIGDFASVSTVDSKSAVESPKVKRKKLPNTRFPALKLSSPLVGSNSPKSEITMDTGNDNTKNTDDEEKMSEPPELDKKMKSRLPKKVRISNVQKGEEEITVSEQDEKDFEGNVDTVRISPTKSPKSARTSPKSDVLDGESSLGNESRRNSISRRKRRESATHDNEKISESSEPSLVVSRRESGRKRIPSTKYSDSLQIGSPPRDAIKQNEERDDKTRASPNRVRSVSNVTRQSEVENPTTIVRSNSVSVRRKSSKQKVENDSNTSRNLEGFESVSKGVSVENSTSTNVRRSVRPHVTTEKLKNFEQQKSTVSSQPKRAKSPSPFNPNSALAIKQRIGKISDQSKSRRSLVKKDGKSFDGSFNQDGEDAKEMETSLSLGRESQFRDTSLYTEKGDESFSRVSEEEEFEELAEAKVAEVEDETSDVRNETVTKVTPKIAKIKKVAEKSPLPVRSSNRVSKPNRLYSDDFSISPLAHKTVTSKAGKVTSVISNNESSERSSYGTSVQSSTGKLKIRLKLGGIDVGVVEEDNEVKNVKLKRSGVNTEIQCGVFIGYKPSVKPYIEDTEVNGEIVKLNSDVSSVIDSLLFQVCNDGVKSHSEIENSYKRFREMKKQKEINRRQSLEAKKLHIHMRSMRPDNSESLSHVSSDENVKRRRFSRVKYDDVISMNYKPKEDRDPDYIVNSEKEMRIQKVRHQLSNKIDEEMVEALQKESVKEGKEAKRLSSRKRKTITLNEYMKQRNVCNRPEVGIKLYNEPGELCNSSSDYFFYEELLTDVPEDEKEISVNEEVDIGVPVSDTSELLEKQREMLLRCNGDSIKAADQIEQLMTRPSNLDGSEHSMDDVFYRAAEQVEQRRQILTSVLICIKQQYINEISPPAVSFNIDSALFNFTSANAQKLKNAFTIYDCPRQESVYWVHKYLVENLPVKFLASYLTLLRYAKPMTSAHIKLIVKSTSGDMYPWNEITDIIMNHVTIKPMDPEIDLLNMTIPYQGFSDTVFLMVSPTLSIGEFYNKPRSQETIFKWLKSIGHPESEVIRAKDDEDETSTIAEFIVDNVIDVIIEKVRQKTRDFPNMRIVVVGWGWTTYAVHRAAVLVHGISAIISLGFPVRTEAGRRGVTDDDIILTYCPTLFVVGSESQFYDEIAMAHLTRSMSNPTGLLLVNHANDQLLVPVSVLVDLGVTQKVVYRLILEKIMEFLRLEETKWERMRLFPVELNNVINVDPMITKSERAQQQQMHQLMVQMPQVSHSPSISSSAASPVHSGRRATVSCVEDVPRATAQIPAKRKRESSSTTSYSSLSPALDSARQKFQEVMLRKVQIPEDIPKRPDTTSKTIEKGDLRERGSITPSSSGALSLSPKSRGPIDPASISLV